MVVKCEGQQEETEACSETSRSFQIKYEEGISQVRQVLIFVGDSTSIFLNLVLDVPL